MRAWPGPASSSAGTPHSLKCCLPQSSAGIWACHLWGIQAAAAHILAHSMHKDGSSSLHDPSLECFAPGYADILMHSSNHGVLALFALPR